MSDASPSSLRKRQLEARDSASGRGTGELDVASCATIAYSSEHPAHPVERMLPLVPPGVAPSFGASVNSQTLRATYAASEVGPAAPWACASVGKFSSRQYNGPDGSSVTFLSTTGSTKNFEGDVNSPKAHSENISNRYGAR
jgi:hypothetical protein